MAKLTAKTRNAIPTKEFAGPARSYPIEDASHARNALSRVSQHGSPELKARVRAAVHRKYPTIGKADGGHLGSNPDVMPGAQNKHIERRSNGGVMSGLPAGRKGVMSV